jgi:hypothetical protein
MRYTLQLEIEVPRPKLVGLFIDPEHWFNWQENLVSYDVLTGDNRETGAKTRILNRFGKKTIEIFEIVESNRLPDEFICTYEAKGAWNRVIHRFTESTPDRTLWQFDSEFRCGGILKLLSTLMPGMFRRASNKELHAFKDFAEKNAAQAKA